MNHYVILLRGFNTGHILLNKTDLENLIIKSGYKDFLVISNTGNIIINSDETLENVKTDVLGELSSYFGQNIYGHVRTGEEIIGLESSFLQEDPEKQHYILFSDKNTSTELIELFNDIDAGQIETLIPIEEDLYWITPKGYTLKGFGKLALGHKKYKSLVTSRNINTVKKIIEALKS